MIIAVIVFVVLIAVLILSHELGHFIAAKMLGVKVEEFGLGFPPRIWAKRKGETQYSVNWIPLGGFVKMLGQSDFEVEDFKKSDGDPRSLVSKKPWKRAVILSAGVGMNFLVAAIFLAIGFGIGLPAAVGDTTPAGGEVTDRKIQIVMVEPGTPAEEAGLRSADQIVSVNGETFTSVAEESDYIRSRTGEAIDFDIRRGNEEFEKEITPVTQSPGEEGAIGVQLAETGIVSFPWYNAIWRGFQGMGLMTLQILEGWGAIIARIATGSPTGAMIAGPVGIAAMTSQATQLGFTYILQFGALLSINLAIINILPLPALDGGHLLFLLIEKVRGKRTFKYLKIQNIIHLIGFAAILGLLAFITYKDIAKFWDKIIGIFT